MMGRTFEGGGCCAGRARAVRLAACLIAVSALASLGSLTFQASSALAGRAPGADPNVGEYWVTATVTLNGFPIGSTGGVGVYDQHCTNGNNGRQFTTTESVQVIEISMLASQSVLCALDKSRATWRINIDGYGYRFMEMSQYAVGEPYYLQCQRGREGGRGLSCTDSTGHEHGLYATIGGCPRADQPICSTGPPTFPMPPGLDGHTHLLPGRAALHHPHTAPGHPHS
jgi:hypothetical protein